MNPELPDVQAGLEKAEEPEIKLATSIGSSKNQESSRKVSTSALLIVPKPLTKWITTNWFQIGKGVRQSCILSPCLFNFYAEDIMRNAGLEETQAGIKISRRNINDLRYADDTTLMAESEELKSLLMKVKKQSEKVGLKLNIQKIKIMASGPITSWEIDGETMETVTHLISWAPKSLQMVTAAMKLKDPYSSGGKL